MWSTCALIVVAVTGVAGTNHRWLEFGRNAIWSISPITTKFDNRSLSYLLEATYLYTAVAAAFYESGVVGTIHAGDKYYQVRSTVGVDCFQLK